MRHRFIAAGALAATFLVLAPAGAMAQAPHGDGGHTHHVILGNGECLDVDSVAFFPGDRGLHRGGNASGSEHGIWHGACPSEG